MVLTFFTQKQIIRWCRMLS